MIASTKFPEKRIGYLAMVRACVRACCVHAPPARRWRACVRACMTAAPQVLLMDENAEVLMLATNTLQNDIGHMNQARAHTRTHTRGMMMHGWWEGG